VLGLDAEPVDGGVRRVCLHPGQVNVQKTLKLERLFGKRAPETLLLSLRLVAPEEVLARNLFFLELPRRYVLPLAPITLAPCVCGDGSFEVTVSSEAFRHGV
jgi:hypothetical protein